MSLRSRLFTQVARGVGALDGWIQARTVAHQRRNQWIVSLLDIRNGMRMLEIGCGPGLRLEYALARAPQCSVVGFDESEPLLRAASRRLASAGERASLIRGSLSDLAQSPGGFDRILAVDAPLSWADPQVAIQTLVAKLATAGQLLLCFDAADEMGRRQAEDFAGLCTTAGLAATRTRSLHDLSAQTVAVMGLKL